MNEMTPTRMKAELPYWIRQHIGALRRARTHREKAKISMQPARRLMMARAAEKDAAKCFRRWQAENPTASLPCFTV
jgi:hypothetical protein